MHLSLRQSHTVLVPTALPQKKHRSKDVASDLNNSTKNRVKMYLISCRGCTTVSITQYQAKAHLYTKERQNRDAPWWCKSYLMSKEVTWCLLLSVPLWQLERQICNVLNRELSASIWYRRRSLSSIAKCFHCDKWHRLISHGEPL